MMSLGYQPTPPQTMVRLFLLPFFLRHSYVAFFAVRKAYKTKALETHPDKLEPTATNRERRAAEGKFRNV